MDQQNALTSAELKPDPAAPGDQLYRVEALEIKELSHPPRAVQDWLAEGRQEGLQDGKAQEAPKLTLRLLNRRCASW
jgi:hypothetical protein